MLISPSNNLKSHGMTTMLTAVITTRTQANTGRKAKASGDAKAKARADIEGKAKEKASSEVLAKVRASLTKALARARKAEKAAARAARPVVQSGIRQTIARLRAKVKVMLHSLLTGRSINRRCKEFNLQPCCPRFSRCLCQTPHSRRLRVPVPYMAMATRRSHTHRTIPSRYLRGRVKVSFEGMPRNSFRDSCLRRRLL